MLSRNKVNLLNNIIYKIYNIEDFNLMRKYVQDSLQLLVPAPILASVVCTNQSVPVLVEPITMGIREEDVLLYKNEFFDKEDLKWLFMDKYSKAYKESDLLGESERKNTIAYKNFFANLNIDYAAILIIAYKERCWGSLTLLRETGEPDFSTEDLFILELLAEHLAIRYYRYVNPDENNSVNTYIREEIIIRYQLTPREHEILSVYLTGTANNAICSLLNISPHTLNKHIANIHQKIGVSSFRELFQKIKQ